MGLRAVVRDRGRARPDPCGDEPQVRELFAVALSEDGASVVLATSPDGSGGRFRLARDGRLDAAVLDELPRVSEQTPPRESTVTPRDIQARLRTGESVDQIAADAGVDVSRVERFAGPVFSERTQMVDSARAATLLRGRRGPSAVPLGVAVDEQLAVLAGLRPETVAWSTVRHETGTWLVEVTYVAQGRRKTCRWSYDPRSRAVMGVNPASADLGHLEAVPARPALNPPAALVVDPGRELFTAGQTVQASTRMTSAAARAPIVKAPAAKAPAAKTGLSRSTPVEGTAGAAGSRSRRTGAPAPRTAARSAARASDETGSRSRPVPTAAASPGRPPASRATEPGEERSAAGPRGAGKKGARATAAPPASPEPPVEDHVARPEDQPVGQSAALRVVPDAHEGPEVRRSSRSDRSTAAGQAAVAGTGQPASDEDDQAPSSSQTSAPSPEAASPTRTAPTTRQPARQGARPSRTGKRASVPAWADVLLSTSAKGDDEREDGQDSPKARRDQDPPAAARGQDGNAG